MESMHGHTVGLQMDAQLGCAWLLNYSMHEHQVIYVWFPSWFPEQEHPVGLQPVAHSRAGRREHTERLLWMCCSSAGGNPNPAATPKQAGIALAPRAHLRAMLCSA